MWSSSSSRLPLIELVGGDFARAVGSDPVLETPAVEHRRHRLDPVAGVLERVRQRVARELGGEAGSDCADGGRQRRDSDPGSRGEREGDKDAGDDRVEGGHVEDVMGDEAPLRGREHDHRGHEQQQRSPPAAEVAGRDPGNGAGGADHQRREHVVVVALVEAIVEPRAARVPGDEIEAAPDIAADVVESLPGREPQHRNASKEAARQDREVSPTVVLDRHDGDRDKREHQRPRIELREDLDRCERAAAIDDQLPGPGGGVVAECSDAPDECEHDDRRVGTDCDSREVAAGERRDGQCDDDRDQRAEVAPQRPDEADAERQVQGEPVRDREPGRTGEEDEVGLQEAEWPVGHDDVGAEVQPVDGRHVEAGVERVVDARLDRRDQPAAPGRDKDEHAEEPGRGHDLERHRQRARPDRAHGSGGGFGLRAHGSCTKARGVKYSTGRSIGIGRGAV